MKLKHFGNAQKNINTIIFNSIFFIKENFIFKFYIKIEK